MEIDALRIINQNEAAKILGTNPNTLANWRWKNIGPRFVKVGSKVGYRLKDIEEWIVLNTCETEQVPHKKVPVL